MNKSLLLIDQWPQYPAPLDQLRCREVFQPRKILLNIHNCIIVSPEGHVKVQYSESRAIHLQIFRREKGSEGEAG